jgi:hypothetical protein
LRNSVKPTPDVSFGPNVLTLHPAIQNKQKEYQMFFFAFQSDGLGNIVPQKAQSVLFGQYSSKLWENNST